MKLIFFYLLVVFINKSQSIINKDDPDKSLDIDITKAPFALSLRLNDRHICGATIISSNWGITAAHCVPLEVSANYSVRSGSNYCNQGGSIHKLIKIIKHQKYNPEDSDCDLAVFMIESEFLFDNSTQPIALPPPNKDQHIFAEWGTAIGWGAFMEEDEDIVSETLRGIELPKIKRALCQNDYSIIFKVTPRQVCYGFQDGHLDTCKGDSGGPLFNKNNILIGITSWGDECGVPNSPGVYTDIKLFRIWIKENTEV